MSTIFDILLEDSDDFGAFLVDLREIAGSFAELARDMVHETLTELRRCIFDPV